MSLAQGEGPEAETDTGTTSMTEEGDGRGIEAEIEGEALAEETNITIIIKVENSSIQNQAGGGHLQSLRIHSSGHQVETIRSQRRDS